VAGETETGAIAAGGDSVAVKAGAAGGGRARPWIIVAAIIALLVGLYAAAGYWLAPRLIRNEAQAWAQDKLKQDLAIGEVKVDPFRFTVDIAGIAIPAGAPMVRVKDLHVNFAARSVFGDSYRFDEIRVVEPEVNAVVRPDGRLNLLDLMPPPSDDPFPAVLIADLNVVRGKALLADHSKANRPQALLTPIGFRLQNLHTTRDEGGGFRLEGRSDADELFVWKGHVSMAPIGSRGGLAIRNLKAKSVQDFAGEALPVALRDGLIDLDLSYTAAYGDKGLNASARLPKVLLKGLAMEGGPALVNADLVVGGLALAGLQADASMPAGGEMTTSLGVGDVALRAIAVTGTGPARGQNASLKAADIKGVRLNPATMALSIDAVRLAGLDTSITRDARGNISAMKLMPVAAPASAPVSAPVSGPPGTAVPMPAPMPVIGEVSLTDARIRLIDQAVKPVTTWTVTPLSISARGTGEPGGAVKLAVAGRLNGATAFSADGDLNPQAPSADLGVKLVGFPVKAAVPYSVDFPALRIVSGTLSADGRVRYSGKDMGYRGGLAVNDLSVVETYQGTDLVKWKRLQLDGIDATPKKASIERARVTEPYSNVTIFPDGTLNFQRLVTFNPQPVVPPSDEVVAAPRKLTRAERRAEEKRLAAEKQQAAAEARAALAAPIREPDIPVLLKRLEVADGVLDFADFSLRPNFGAKVQGVNGTLSNLSNSPRAVAKVKLDGFVIDKHSPVTIAGDITPMQYDRRTHIDMAFRNIELPVFNPYSGRWAGYSIAKGKLTTELSYAIDNRALEAKHHIVIDQLEWGDATDSKEKVSMPIKFATSLLKDKNGVIELDVPVSGTLDDPSFKLGPIIWKVIGNLMEKVLTAPFRALGDLFGGKEDVQFVDFEPGSSSMPPAAASNLAGIAKGLADKPELRLDIPAGPGLPLDADSIADRRMADAAMAKEVKKGQPADLAALEPDKRHDRLEDLYKARTKARPAYPPAPEGEDKAARHARETAWLIAELRKSFAPTPAELAALGKARAETVRQALLQGGTTVDPARLFISGRDSATEKDGRARMELKLEGS
jgi:hypothetical protein